jgi:Tannase and feruloyl esterase/Alpha/beta hydrolase domain
MWTFGNLVRVLVLTVVGAAPAFAEVVKLEIVSREPMNGGFELIKGKIYGELDPKDPHNAIIQDIALAPRNARGNVEYVATFALAKPIDMTKAARVLLYQVVNRGNGQAVASAEGYISLVSGWQGDVIPTVNNQTIVVPIAKQLDGSPITGPVVARFVDIPNGASTAAIHLASNGTAEPYLPVDLVQPKATLTWHASETYAGVQDAPHRMARDEWAFANCETTPWPGTPDPLRICLRNGFRADRIYELVYTAKDPLVLGVGLAATRDIVSFFHHAQKDAAGTSNPVADAIDRVVSVGDSQSGNFIRTFIHLGFNQDERNRIVWDGAFPRIAARQTPMNLRFALPGGAALTYEPGSEGVVWWTAYEDKARGLKKAGLLDRCTATKTCPKIIEAFGSSEFWGLRMSPDLVGTDATHDLPLPDNVRRYYYPGTTHGGGRGGFRVEAAAAPGTCSLPPNPNPEAEQTRALTRALVDWVTNGTPPPASRYPTLANGDLVPATRAAVGFREIPGLPFSDRILNPLMHYDFGPDFKGADLSGVMSIVPPRILGTLPTFVPRVNEDGNETAGVPSVLMQAPLGTYLGWNTVRSGFFAGYGCGYQGGYIPFAKTKAERERNNDPRQSVEERYGTLEGYVCTVKHAADKAVADRVLLRDDGERFVREAEASSVLPWEVDAGPDAVATGRRLCQLPTSQLPTPNERPTPNVQNFQDSQEAKCQSVVSLTLAHGTITSAHSSPAGQVTAGGRTFTVPAVCRVMVTSKPSPDSEIKIEVWLPDSAQWNGALLGTDNGGFSGAINYAALTNGITKGYAAVSTDTGHAGDQMDFGIGHSEKIVDWAYRSIHEMTAIAKAVVEKAEGRAPSHAYFSGCSTGGQQALSEAQRYPADYDGIVAGDPGNNRVNLIYGFLWSWLATHDADGTQILPSAKLPALAKAAVAACDKSDGLEDGLISDLNACRFDPAVLACKGAETDACLTPRQIDAAKKVYAGAKTRAGRQLYPGWAPGSEAGWGTYITSPREPVRIGLFRGWVFQNPSWDPRSFDWDKDVAAVDAKYPFLNAMSTDYRAFKARGGKLIMYTGLADPVVSPFDTFAYYDSVAKAMGGLEPTQSFYRFFPVPGMGHCGGGAGPNTFDALSALAAWVEKGVAPESIPASHSTNGQIDRTRPLCAYPAVAKYKGSGSIDDAANFSCVAR